MQLEERLEYFDVVATTGMKIIRKKTGKINKFHSLSEIKMYERFEWIAYRGVRQCISRKMAMASPDTEITDACFITF